MKLQLLSFAILSILFNGYFARQSFSQRPCPKSPKETYLLHLGSYPRGAVSFGQGMIEVQGITFITNNNHPRTIITSVHRGWVMSGWLPSQRIDNAYLFKIPVTLDLQKIDVFHNGDVVVKTLHNYPPLWNPNPTMPLAFRKLTGYVHWGDVDHYVFNKVEYLIIPMTSEKPGRDKNKLEWGDPAVFIFRAADLSLVAYDLLDNTDGKGQKDVGWCAVNPQTGDLYTSEDRTTKTLKYTIPWNLLPRSGYMGRLKMKYIKAYSLHGKGTTILDLHNMQGGEFTPSGELLYISNGAGRCKKQGANDPGMPTDGIHLFDVATWKEIKHSTNRMYYRPGESNCCQPYSDYFDFTYDFRCGKFEAHSEQPEGIGIRDFSKIEKHDPHMNGQLHVLVASVGLFGNQAWIEHYTNKISVDQVHGYSPVWNVPFPGTGQRPFKTVAAAVNFYPAWEGAQIAIKTKKIHKESIMTMEGIVGYKITGTPSKLKQGQLFPDIKIVLRNYSTKAIRKIIAVDFLLSPKPITPDLNRSKKYEKIGTFYRFVNLTPFASATFVVKGLRAPSKKGLYYLGTTADCGPISSPGNPTSIQIVLNVITSTSRQGEPGTEDIIEDTIQVKEMQFPDTVISMPIFDSLKFFDQKKDTQPGNKTIEGHKPGSAGNFDTDSNKELKVFPNPASGKVTVMFNNKTGDDYVLSFLDPEGRIVFVKQGKAYKGVNFIEFDISHFRKGSYFINILTDHLNTSTKLLIQ